MKRAIALEPPVVDDRSARVERMIDCYRRATRRRLERKALAIWRNAEARQEIVEHERRPERIH